MTEDGGIHFTEIQLPMDQITEVPEPGKSYGLTLDDYHYLTMPTYDGTTLRITVTSGSAENDGIEFHSTDSGKTWEVIQ